MVLTCVIFVLQDLIDFCKDIGLQSSAAATRNATVKLIGVLHKFVGPGDTFCILIFHSVGCVSVGSEVFYYTMLP